MLLKVFDLRPGFGPYREYHGSSFSVLSPGNPGRNYSFIVGTRTKPTKRDRERIERAIAAAWAGIFDPHDLEKIYQRKFTVPPYGVTVVPDSSPSSGETVLPPFRYNHYYIVFALLESDNGSAVSEDEEREVSESITKAIENQVRNMAIKPRIGVVTLYNCSVQMLEGEGFER